MFIVRLVSRIPLGILYLLSDFLFFMAYYVIRYRRTMVISNLQHSFPEKSKSELHAIEKEYYKNLCDYAVETLKLITIRKEELAKRMVFKTPEIPIEYANQNQSFLMLASHQFNWEWLLAATSFNLPMGVDFVYQKVNNDFFENVLLAGRTRFGAYPIRRDEVARKTIQRKNILRAVAMLADQYPGHDTDKKYPTTFLNQETVFFLGPNQIAVLMQYPVLYYEIRKVKRGYYETTAIEIAKPPYTKDSFVIVDHYVKAVEDAIQKHSASWLWSHNRWKQRHLKNT